MSELQMVKQNEDGNTDSNTNWSLLLKEALTLINDVPQFPFLYGAFDPAHTPEPKQRKQRVREPQEKHTKKQLERVQIVSKEEEGIEDTVNFLERVLKQEYESNGKNPISYMRFIVDSDDFSATVENNFYSAFLIRDGKAKLSFDKGQPFIEMDKNRDLKGFRDDGGKNVQDIASFTMNQWEEIRGVEGYIQKHKRLLQSRMC